MSPKRRDTTDPAETAHRSGDRPRGDTELPRSPASTARRRQQAAVKNKVNSFLEGLTELATELDLGAPDHHPQPIVHPIPGPPDVGGTPFEHRGPSDLVAAPPVEPVANDETLPGDTGSSTSVTGAPITGSETVAEPAHPGATPTGVSPAHALMSTAATAERPAIATQVRTVDLRAWAPNLAMAPLAPLAPPRPRPVNNASLLTTHSPPPPPHRGSPVPTLLLIMGTIFIVFVAGVVYFLSHQRSPHAPSISAGPTAPPTAATTPEPTPSPSADLQVSEVRLVSATSPNPFAAPTLTSAPAPQPFLILVVRYQQQGGDGKIDIGLSRVGLVGQPGQNLLNRTYLLSGSGADVIYLMPPVKTFPAGHYLLDVTYTRKSVGSLVFDILPGPAPAH